MSDEKSKSMWMTKLSNQTQELINNSGIPADMGDRIKDFMFKIAREQYKAGNINGIRWARTNPQPNPQT